MDYMIEILRILKAQQLSILRRADALKSIPIRISTTYGILLSSFQYKIGWSGLSNVSSTDSDQSIKTEKEDKVLYSPSANSFAGVSNFFRKIIYTNLCWGKMEIPI